MFPILNPPTSSLPIPSLWVVPVHQPQASSIVHWTWTGDTFHIWYYTCFKKIWNASRICVSSLHRGHANLCIVPILVYVLPKWAPGSFPMSQFFASGGQSIGVSPSASVLPMNIQDWVPLGWTGWISLPSKDSQKSFPIPQFKSQKEKHKYSILTHIYGI